VDEPNGAASIIDLRLSRFANLTRENYADIGDYAASIA
jgi:hypothetical protein